MRINRLVMLNAKNFYGPMAQRVGVHTYVLSGQGNIGIIATSGSTVDVNGDSSNTNVTICFNTLPDSANYLTGVELVGSETGSFALSSPVVNGNCITYTVAPSVAPDETLTWTLDNSAEAWTDPETGDPISNQSVNVTNLYQSPKVVNAVVDSLGTTLTITLSEEVTGNVGFTLTADAVGKTLSSAVNSGNTITFTCEQIEQNELCLLSYTAGNVQDLDLIPLANFSNKNVTNNSTYSPDITAPNVLSSVVDTLGTTLTITLDEAVTGNVGFSLTADGSAVAISAPANSTDIITFTTAQIYQGQVCLLSYTAGDVQDLSGNALVDFADAAVTNNSTVVDSGVQPLLQLPQPNETTGLYDMSLWEDERGSTINVTDYQGVVREIPLNVPALFGARVVDTGPGTIEYYDTEGDGSTKIDPPPHWEHWPQSENILEQSYSVGTAPWTPRGTIVVTLDNSTAPNGELEATRLDNLNTTGNGDLRQTQVGFAVDAVVSTSFYIQRISTVGDMRVTNPFSGSLGTWLVDLSLLSDGWERITEEHPAVTVTTSFKTNSSGNTGMQFASNADDNLSILVWGSQQELIDITTPVIETTTASAIRYATLMRYPYSTDVFNQAEGMLYMKATPTRDQADIGTGQGVVSVADIASNLLYADSSGIHSTDGTNTADVNPSVVADTEYPVAVTWSAANGIRIGWYNGASWVWDVSAAAYDGGYTSQTYINLFYGSDALGVKFEEMEIYDTDGGTTWMETNKP